MRTGDAPAEADPPQGVVTRASPYAHRPLEPPCEREHEHDHEQKADDAAWCIAPITAVAPCREPAHKDQDKEDNEDERHATPHVERISALAISTARPTAPAAALN